MLITWAAKCCVNKSGRLEHGHAGSTPWCGVMFLVEDPEPQSYILLIRATLMQTIAGWSFHVGK